MCIPKLAMSGSEDEENSETDWTRCALWQNENQESLQCPAESKRVDVGAGYRTLANNIVRFNELGSIPLQINLSRIDDGNGIEETFITRAEGAES